MSNTIVPLLLIASLCQNSWERLEETPRMSSWEMRKLFSSP